MAKKKEISVFIFMRNRIEVLIWGLSKGAGATGAAGAAAPFALVVRGQRGGSILPYQYLNAN